MLSLLDTQTCFSEAVLQNKTASFDKRLQIYRNNIFITLTETLRLTYPNIEKIVGKDFFDGLAAEYIKKYPSLTPDLHAFGSHLAEFLTTFSPATSLPYLPEFAQLEWGCYQIFHEREVPTFNMSALQNIPEDSYASLKFFLNSACRLYAFHYPIYRIWQLCHEEADNNHPINLSEGGVHLLIIRPEFEIKFYLLSPGEFSFLKAISENKLFGEVCEATLSAEPNIDVGMLLQKYLLSGAITDFVL